MKETKQRLGYIDFLKTIGMLGLILAHVNAPEWLIQLRSFDVPLMVILSGILAGRQYQKFTNQGGYVKARFIRLIIPTWIFLSVYFLGLYFAAGQAFGLNYYLKSFLFQNDGIGYVWIILVYFICAIMVPGLTLIPYKKTAVLSVLIVYCLYEFAYYHGVGVNSRVLNCTIYYALPYGVLTLLGLWYYKINDKVQGLLVLIFGLIFTVMAIAYIQATGRFQLTNIAKYPPRIYYLSYAIAVCFCLLLYFKNHNFRFYSWAVIRFFGSHSLWIYLWHIAFLTVSEVFLYQFPWFVQYVAVIVLSCVTVWVQNRVLDCLEKGRPRSYLKVFRG